MTPRGLAPDVRLLRAGPAYSLNCYLVGSTLVDSGLWFSGRALRRQLRGSRVDAHALTHAHADHAGSSAWLCDRLGVPLAVGAGDAEAVETGRMNSHGSRLARAVMRALPARARGVDRVLREGDHLDAGFEVLDAPGHSPGAIALWRARDRVLICGDVLYNAGLPRRASVRDLPGLLHHDAGMNAAARRRIVGLAPNVLAFGHGPPITDPGRIEQALAGQKSPARRDPGRDGPAPGRGR